MKNFTSVDDIGDPKALVQKVLHVKKNPFVHTQLGVNKVLGLIFFNSSLRTRMSTVRAAYNLGLKVMTLNVSSDSWQLEMEDGTVMDQGKAEHIKEAIPIMGSYCDILGVRSFPTLEDRDEDYKDLVLHSFLKLAKRPIINLESATLHPLQSLTDLVTIEEFKTTSNPKVVLTWAPHVKPLPQSVANSFAQWMVRTKYDFTVTHPEGFGLSEEFTKGAQIEYDQSKALEQADFVYVKNWSSFQNYGEVGDHPDWMIDQEKLKVTNPAKVMHCLPVRRNVVIADDVLDSEQSIVVQQAENRLYAAQAVLIEILKALEK